jgi:hypothetical protein
MQASLCTVPVLLLSAPLSGLSSALRALSQYERASIGPTGAIAAGSGVCKGPYDALNGSALAWCALFRMLTMSCNESCAWCLRCTGES